MQENCQLLDFKHIKEIVFSKHKGNLKILRQNLDLEFATAKSIFLKWYLMIGKSKQPLTELDKVPVLIESERIRILTFGYKRQAESLANLEKEVT
jgi:hypothetical protein